LSWATTSLGEIAERVDYGVTASATSSDTGSKFLRITDIQNGYVDWSQVPFCNAAPKKLEATRLRDGDIVFARTGATTGKSFLIASPPSGAVFASYLIRVRPSRVIDPGYLAHFFQSTGYWAQVRAKTQGAAQGGVNSTSLRKLLVPLPSLHEQRRIAAILDKADTLRRKRKSTLQLLDSLRNAYFAELFIAGASGSWPTVTVSDVSEDIRTGPFGSQLLHSEFVDEGVPVLGIDNAVSNEFRWSERRFISEQKYRQLKRYTVRPGDVLITIMGTCGRCAIVPDGIQTAINTKHLCCVTLKKDRCAPEFLQAALLTHPDVLRQLGVQAKGAVMPGLNMGIIKSLKLQLPPIEMQNTFASGLRRLEKLSLQGRAHQQALEILFASLQSRAFSGQL
jgi:type I restriction enzyme, S subunit